MIGHGIQRFDSHYSTTHMDNYRERWTSQAVELSHHKMYYIFRVEILSPCFLINNSTSEVTEKTIQAFKAQLLGALSADDLHKHNTLYSAEPCNRWWNFTHCIRKCIFLYYPCMNMY
ncbi:unnamed protein product [Sphenostylis stenocarpa]|uniref:Uncharacterized protein n=1 Tax=Sphenostylis stenocarpa TaxID=92480 RepID=A0AA86RZJ0_9FABA|nr:unnamed protein product [Sphenostylis stenocarpa]